MTAEKVEAPPVVGSVPLRGKKPPRRQKIYIGVNKTAQRGEAKVKGNVSTALIFIVGSIAFAGCVGGAESAAPEAGASSTVDAGSGTGSVVEGGAIEGRVLDDELNALPAAQVALLNTTVQAITDESGAFKILGVAPGTYSLVAAKLGYESRALKVLVEPGQTSYVNLTLAALPTGEVYYSTFHRTELIDCMMHLGIWVSACSYPYTAVYLTAHQNGVNLSQYGVPDDIQENRVRFNISLGFGVEEVVSEMIWTANTPASDLLMLRTCKMDYDPVIDDCTQHGIASGMSPLRFDWKVPNADRPAQPGETKWAMSLIWPAFDEDPGVILEQKVDVYHTSFFGGKAPDDWSVLPPGG